MRLWLQAGIEKDFFYFRMWFVYRSQWSSKVAFDSMVRYESSARKQSPFSIPESFFSRAEARMEQIKKKKKNDNNIPAFYDEKRPKLNC